MPPRTGINGYLPAIRQGIARLSACADLDGLFEETLSILADGFAVDHAILFLPDERFERLFTIASRGYAESGAGSEIRIGDGVVGLAARERTPIRIMYASSEYRYGRSVRCQAERHGLADALESEIPLPGLPEPSSQMAVPILRGDHLLGVVYVEGTEDGRFGYEEEDAVAILTAHMGALIPALRHAAVAADPVFGPRDTTDPHADSAVSVRYFATDRSVFLGDDYLIKGVAGAIFWKLACAHVLERRCDFTNRELRADPVIGLPSFEDNLETRLILLQRRLGERFGFVRIEKTGRGRFRFAVDRPLRIVEVPEA